MISLEIVVMTIQNVEYQVLFLKKNQNLETFLLSKGMKKYNKKYSNPFLLYCEP